MLKKNKGFTLIELLVVIAIIGILAAVIIANLGGARTAARDGAVKAQMDSLRSQMELYNLYNGGSYGTAANCTVAPFVGTANNAAGNLILGIKDSGVTDSNIFCGANGTAWAVSVHLPSGSAGDWCVDSNGASTAAITANGGTVCP